MVALVAQRGLRGVGRWSLWLMAGLLMSACSPDDGAPPQDTEDTGADVDLPDTGQSDAAPDPDTTPDPDVFPPLLDGFPTVQGERVNLGAPWEETADGLRNLLDSPGATSCDDFESAPHEVFTPWEDPGVGPDPFDDVDDSDLDPDPEGDLP